MAASAATDHDEAASAAFTGNMVARDTLPATDQLPMPDPDMPAIPRETASTTLGSDMTARNTLPASDLLPAPPVTDAIGQLVKDFYAGLRSTTLKSYQQALSDFTRFLDVDRVDEAARVLLSRGPGKANQLVFQYRNDLAKRNLSVATINLRLAALRSLTRLGRIVGLIDFALEIRNLRDEGYRDTRGPGTDGVRRLLDQAAKHRSPAHAARDVALLRLMFDLGLRRGSVVSLDVEHLDLDESGIQVKVKGKTGRVRRSLPDQTKQALQHWLRYRGDHSGAVFVSFDRSRKSCRLTGRSVHRIIQRLGADVGIVARPHGLRHSAITAALDATNGNIRAVQKFAGHSDVRMIEKYDDCRRDVAGSVARRVADCV
jgi:integrase/recombinase XerC